MRLSKYLPLNKAAELLAASLGGTDPEGGADPALLETARQQLVQALYDGDMKSKGVLWEIPVQDEQGELPLEQPDVWVKLKPGWWSNARYQHLDPTRITDGDKLSESDEQLRRSFYEHLTEITDVDQEELVTHTPIGPSQSGVLLDKIILFWDRNYLEIYDDGGDPWGYALIRVSRPGFEAYFGLGQADASLAKSKDAKIGVASGVRRLKTRPNAMTKGEIRQEILSFPPKSMDRQEILDHIRDHRPSISRVDAREIYNDLPEEYKYRRGEKKNPPSK